MTSIRADFLRTANFLHCQAAQYTLAAQSTTDEWREHFLKRAIYCSEKAADYYEAARDEKPLRKLYLRFMDWYIGDDLDDPFRG